ncbi:DUF4270 family protein [Bacteroidota bacterium]
MTNILSLSAKRISLIVASAALVLSTAFVFISCDNPDDFDFKTNRIDDQYDFFQADSVVRMYTVREDSLRSDEFTLDLIGIYKDNNFGRIKSSVYTELRLPGTDVELGTNPVLDSIVLYMKYYSSDAYFGWLNDPLKFNVYELNQRIYRDSAYYSTSSINYSPQLVGSVTTKPKPENYGVLRIKLSSDFGQKILDADKFQLADDDDFLELINGLAIVPEEASATGSIISFFLEHDSSNVTLYYRNDEDTIAAVFQINNECARISKFEQDFSSTPIQEQLNNPGKLYDKVFIKPMAGTKVKVDFSAYLSELAKSSLYAINRAELIIKPDNSLPYLSKKPPSLLLLKTNKDNVNFALIDRFESYFDGVYDPVNGSYSIIITRYVQEELLNYYNDPDYKSDYQLNLIIPSDNPIIADPLVLRANQDLSSAILKLSYTRVK